MSELANQRMTERVRVKVCGLTNVADARVALEAGADLLGFIFYEKSPRYVSPDVVREIIAEITNYELRITNYVGVFVNTSAPQIAGILDFCRLDLAQLHGEEGPDHFAGGLAGRAFKALRPRSAAEAEAAAARFAYFGPDNGPDLLVDAYHPALRGGTGEVADWRLAAGLARQHRLLLAGGPGDPPGASLGRRCQQRCRG